MLGCHTMGSNCKLPSHRDRQSQAMSFGRDNEKENGSNRDYRV